MKSDPHKLSMAQRMKRTVIKVGDKRNKLGKGDFIFLDPVYKVLPSGETTSSRGYFKRNEEKTMFHIVLSPKNLRLWNLLWI